MERPEDNRDIKEDNRCCQSAEATSVWNRGHKSHAYWSRALKGLLLFKEAMGGYGTSTHDHAI